jgi:hypothetical protein
MDLLALPARWLARPAAAALGVEGETSLERRRGLSAEMNGSTTDLDILNRHIARAVVWGVLLAFVVPVVLTIAIVLAMTIRGTMNVTSAVLWGVPIFMFWMACVHGVKALVTAYVLDGRWRPGSRPARVLMLSQIPDVVVALAVTVALQVIRN